MPVADYRLRARRVGAVGGSRITALNAKFCEFLGEQLAREEGLVIVTGGRQGGADAPAADACIVEGVRRYLREKGIAEDSRLETLIPKGKSTGLFRAGRIHEVNVTRQSRRFALVRYADVLVTIAGEHGTPEMVDLALEFEKPVLPLPFTGGRSEKQWHDHKDVIAKRLRMDKETCQRLETPLDAGNVRAAAQLVKDLVVSALKRRCFVAMPFAPDFEEIYRIVKNACDSMNLIPVRTDELLLVGNVVDIIREGIASCECAVAVITGQNPNVMYELGLAHALYKPTLLICENDRGGHLPRLPFDLQTQDVVGYSRSDLGKLQDAIYRKLAMTVPHD